MNQHIFNLKPDAPDHRDRLFVAVPSAAPLPAIVDLRAQCPPVYDQGQLGSCTGNCYAAIADMRHQAQTGQFFGPSRLFIYYFERVLEHTVSEDAGASMRDGAKVLSKYGVCRETTWPYHIDMFAEKPNSAAVAEGKLYLALSYARVAQSLNQMRTVLAGGTPIAIGISVYDSFESAAVAKTGKVPLPNVHKESLLGGHAVAVVGYNDTQQVFIVRNSWGPGWGDQGYFYLPYQYALNPKLASDFWVIRKVE